MSLTNFLVYKLVGAAIKEVAGLFSGDETKPASPSTPSSKTKEEKKPSSAKRAIATKRRRAIEAFAQREALSLSSKLTRKGGVAARERETLLEQAVKAKCDLYNDEANPLSDRLDALYDLEERLKEKLEQVPPVTRRRKNSNV